MNTNPIRTREEIICILYTAYTNISFLAPLNKRDSYQYTFYIDEINFLVRVKNEIIDLSFEGKSFYTSSISEFKNKNEIYGLMKRELEKLKKLEFPQIKSELNNILFNK